MPETPILSITCPVCAEELEVPASDWQTFAVGDVLVCESCGAELEVASLDPPEFELLGLLTTCPSCGQEVELEGEELEDGREVTCPHCQAHFELEFEEVAEDRPQA